MHQRSASSNNKVSHIISIIILIMKSTIREKFLKDVVGWQQQLHVFFQQFDKWLLLKIGLFDDYGYCN